MAQAPTPAPASITAEQIAELALAPQSVTASGTVTERPIEEVIAARRELILMQQAAAARRRSPFRCVGQAQAVFGGANQ